MSKRRITAGCLVGATMLLAAPVRALDLDDVVRRQKQLAPPRLAVSPARLEVEVQQGKTGTVSLEVANAGGQTLNWRIASAPKWITPASRAGSLGFEKQERLSLAAETGSLPAGTHEGTVVVDADAAGSAAVTVVVTVTPKPKPPERPKVPPREPDRITSPRAPLDSVEEPRKGAFGVRAGMMLPGSGDVADYDSGFLFGLYYRSSRLNGEKFNYELALGIGGTSEGGGHEARPATGSFNVLFPVGKDGRSTRGYLLSGLGGMVEFVDEQATGSGYTNYAGILNLGGGLAFGGGKYDLRLAYSVLLGSENIGGHGLLAMGYSF